METTIEQPQFGIFTRKKIEQIERVVCEYMGETPDRIKERCRLRSRVISRHIIFYLLRQHTKLTLTQIANYYGLDNHSTAIKGITALHRRMYLTPEFKKQVDQISLIVTTQTRKD